MRSFNCHTNTAEKREERNDDPEIHLVGHVGKDVSAEVQENIEADIPAPPVRLPSCRVSELGQLGGQICEQSIWPDQFAFM